MATPEISSIETFIGIGSPDNVAEAIAQPHQDVVEVRVSYSGLQQHMRALGPKHQGDVSLYIPRGILKEEAPETRQDPISFFHNLIVVSFGERELYLEGAPAQVGPREFDLAAYLAQPAGVIRSRKSIQQYAWGVAAIEHPRNVDVQVSNLRQKIPAEAIRTRQGFGYFAVP